jgi:hypothetical protein
MRAQGDAFRFFARSRVCTFCTTPSSKIRHSLSFVNLRRDLLPEGDPDVGLRTIGSENSGVSRFQTFVFCASPEGSKMLAKQRKGAI